MKRFITLSVAVLCCVAAGSTVLAQNAPPTPEEQAQQAAELRQSVFKLLGWNMGPLAAMLRKRMPFDAAMAQKSATRIEDLAPMIADAFQHDTRKFELKTQARDAIWSNKADFEAKAMDLIKAAGELSAAARTGDQGATLKAAGTVGKACGACHDSYRDE